MEIGVPREIVSGERRVALVPESVKRLMGAEHHVMVQSGAGREAGCTDNAYADAGAQLVADAAALYAASHLIVKIQPPALDMESGQDEIALLRPGALLVATLQPLVNRERMRELAERGITSF